jgi:hypothetical protein
MPSPLDRSFLKAPLTIKCGGLSLGTLLRTATVGLTTIKVSGEFRCVAIGWICSSLALGGVTYFDVERFDDQ